MDRNLDNLVKEREIRFCTLNPNADYARNATVLLAEFDGVHQVDAITPHLIEIRYDISYITLSIIEDVLLELGFHLDNSLIWKLKRSLYAYTEETQRANMGLPHGADHSVQVFISRYRRLRHGCRDSRPRHWRSYR